jgi:hypothetical protein
MAPRASEQEALSLVLELELGSSCSPIGSAQHLLHWQILLLPQAPVQVLLVLLCLKSVQLVGAMTLL